jgi:hypothetical protein
VVIPVASSDPPRARLRREPDVHRRRLERAADRHRDGCE